MIGTVDVAIMKAIVKATVVNSEITWIMNGTVMSRSTGRLRVSNQVRKAVRELGDNASFLS